MTQMANPLTALIHAVQVMNFLKTLILTTLRERLSAAAEARQLHSYCGSHRDGDSPDGFEHAGHSFLDVDKENSTIGASYVTSSGNLFSTLDSDSDAEESFQSFEKRTETDDTEFISERWSPTLSNGPKRGDDHRDVEGLLDRLNIKKRVKKLSTHPLFQLTRPTKEGEVDVVVSMKEQKLGHKSVTFSSYWLFFIVVCSEIVLFVGIRQEAHVQYQFLPKI
ncbi:hypothetical protein HPP92_021930 [Vanilla planifolia]|uniref:Uncharacterized protein n=1 Tax=Vanilla planifolia TaxID=51239 RepID=A0A835PZK9_VANPL|nr:hypothetical protein HPP92_021930 [Vanilla planifolia]